jgi:Ca2+-binding RTX toxin-like protein
MAKNNPLLSFKVLISMEFPASFDLTSFNSSQGVVIESDLEFGSFSPVGDINGDGIDDLIIVNPSTTIAGQRFAGGVYVVFGGSDFAQDGSLDLRQLKPSEGFRIDGSSGSGGPGGSVSGAGDVNGDGIEDLLISASGVDSNGLNNRGAVVIFGSRDLSGLGNFNLSELNGTNGFRINGEGGYASIGVVSGGGDINGDGFDDLLLGAPDVGYSDIFYSASGRVYVVFGDSNIGDAGQLDLSDLTIGQGLILEGSGLDRLGTSLSAAGDFNQDGFDDFVVGGTPTREPNYYAGAAAIVLGGRDIAGDLGFGISGSSGSYYSEFGFSVSGAGDFNGDGFDDVIIGSPGSSSADTYENGGISSYLRPGSSFLIFGGNSGQLTLEGINGGDRAGSNVSFAGDLNGDGFDDIVIDARARNFDGSFGQSYVIFGGPDWKSGDTFNLSQLNGQNGFTITGSLSDRIVSRSGFAGDLNHDGIDDVIIASNTGAYVLFGQQVDLPSPNRIEGTFESDQLIGTSDDDVIRGLIGNDTLQGRAGNDRLVGNVGNDLLVGGSGKDRLFGGSGFDSLRGGDGEDEFFFQNIRHEADRILDFKADEDSILIRKAGFDLDLSKGQLSNSRFVLGSIARDRGDRFIYNAETGALLFDADGTGRQRAQTIAFLNPGDTLNASDIRIV